jgi:protein tyrosine phosphatase (PTP) superfamily phosphohydrolase (DUF442 family)
MTSIVRIVRDWMRGIPKDVPLDYSRITENLYIAAWPTKHDVEKIKSLGVRLIVSTILERTDKELNAPPLTLVRVHATDLGSRLIFPTSQLLKGVKPTVGALQASEGVMDFCKAGKHRSATMTACVLVGLGHTADEAISMVKQGRAKADFKPAHIERIKSFEEVWTKQQATKASKH